MNVFPKKQCRNREAMFTFQVSSLQSAQNLDHTKDTVLTTIYNTYLLHLQKYNNHNTSFNKIILNIMCNVNEKLWKMTKCIVT